MVNFSELGTSEVDPNIPLSSWMSMMRDALYQVDIKVLGDGPFSCHVLRRPFGAGELLRFNVSGQHIKRTEFDVSRDHCTDIGLIMVLEGTQRLWQYNRELCAHKRDCYLFDMGTEFESIVEGLSSCLMIRIPRTWLSSINVEDIAARLISGRQPWGNALSSLLNAIYADIDATLPLTPTLLVEQSVSLIELALGDICSGPTTHQSRTMRRVRMHMIDCLADSSLSPATVAEGIGISRSYLHKLFENTDTSFSKVLSELRIEKAAAFLRSPKSNRLNISEVSFRSGFSSIEQFCRKFKAAYGVTPSEYRRYETSRQSRQASGSPNGVC